MKKNTTCGTYYFEDGYIAWFFGLSTAERRQEERKHGRILMFLPDKN
jgi:hypothetical protein